MVLVAYAGPVRPAAALRDSVLCLPTDIHSLLVNNPSSSSSSSSSCAPPRWTERGGLRIRVCLCMLTQRVNMLYCRLKPAATHIIHIMAHVRDSDAHTPSVLMYSAADALHAPSLLLRYCSRSPAPLHAFHSQ